MSLGKIIFLIWYTSFWNIKWEQKYSCDFNQNVFTQNKCQNLSWQYTNSNEKQIF